MRLHKNIVVIFISVEINLQDLQVVMCGVIGVAPQILVAFSTGCNEDKTGWGV